MQKIPNHWRWIAIALCLSVLQVAAAPALKKNEVAAIGLVEQRQCFAPAAGASAFEPLRDEARAASLSAILVEKYHYLHPDLDDAASIKIFDGYLKMLDGQRLFFLQSDIDCLTPARTALDDVIRGTAEGEDAGIPFVMYDLYRQRLAERIAHARALLGKGFDFTAKESYEADRKDAAWPASTDELNDLWRKRVKNDWLRLKLAGKQDKEIAAILDKRYANLLSSVSKIKRDEVFQSFMDVWTNSIDPHSDYMGVKASDQFSISMRLSLFGIGALLQEKDDYITIRELTAGSPAMLSGQIKVGDRIVGVAQGEKGEMVDVSGWRVDDAVTLIRGEENTVVVLDILPVGAGPDVDHKRISLVRKKITLDKQEAKKSVIEVKKGQAVHRIGVITLPGFYQDFAARENGQPNFKSATRDVANILADFRKEGVEGVLVDLRNNGGGSLDEAVGLVGLFVGKGPVVMQRNADGRISALSNTTYAQAWDGPMGVLINRASASASEIFAAAIQDYGRGVVIGDQSFGKGTVQTMLSLDEFVGSSTPKLGELKMTIAQFFRVNGGTTQLRGVTPDIVLPSAMSAEDFGESGFDNALPWTEIPAAKYVPSGDLSRLVPLLTARHAARASKDKDFQNLEEDIADIKTMRERKQISLNEAERRKERDEREAKLKSRQNDVAQQGAEASSHDFVFRDDGLSSSERDLDADIALEKARKDAKDVLLNESANIVSDEAELLKVDPGLAQKVMAH
ncbi:MAG: carboxy terminal-processing peptidase [Gallionellaceae bacterium]|jgi:carboxyl-terminal processing protease|nr:carboxy terminal-processing peptidase [Gallionellaceae bacterium]